MIDGYRWYEYEYDLIFYMIIYDPFESIWPISTLKNFKDHCPRAPILATSCLGSGGWRKSVEFWREFWTSLNPNNAHVMCASVLCAYANHGTSSHQARALKCSSKGRPTQATKCKSHPTKQTFFKENISPGYSQTSNLDKFGFSKESAPKVLSGFENPSCMIYTLTYFNYTRISSYLYVCA